MILSTATAFTGLRAQVQIFSLPKMKRSVLRQSSQWRWLFCYRKCVVETPQNLLRACADLLWEVSFSPVPLRHGIASEPLTELAHARAQVQGDAKVLRACQMDLKQRRSMSRFGCVLWPVASDVVRLPTASHENPCSQPLPPTLALSLCGSAHLCSPVCH